MNEFAVIFVFLIAFMAYNYFFEADTPKLGKNVTDIVHLNKIHYPPEQVETHHKTLYSSDEFTIVSAATFDLEARVLGTERYYFDQESSISPVDLALGWQQMAQSSIINQLRFSQRGRWYYYEYDNPPPLPKTMISRQSANMHMIPSSDEVRSILLSIKEGDLIRLSGNLVNVIGEDNWEWNSSLTRNDVGNGACEVVWVKSVQIL